MGSSADGAAADERPVHDVRVSPFWIDVHEVTVREFAEFVAATGYVTTAEREGNSLVFRPPEGANVRDFDWSTWWEPCQGADWRHPDGPDSTIVGKEDHPVVHVSWIDATRYAEWKGLRLPTEAEWEFAARGGRDRSDPTLRDAPDACCANIWQGEFPSENTVADGYRTTSPVGALDANAFGVHDMAGNVWEWCADRYGRMTYLDRFAMGAISVDPRGVPENVGGRVERSLRGGSFLCSDVYCTGYRPSARMHATPESSFSHTGFRCVRGE